MKITHKNNTKRVYLGPEIYNDFHILHIRQYNRIYKQTYRTPMGFLLSPNIGDITLYESKI